MIGGKKIGVLLGMFLLIVGLAEKSLQMVNQVHQVLLQVTTLLLEVGLVLRVNKFHLRHR